VVGKGSRQKYARLLENRDLRRWYDNTSRGSRVTADVYLRRLGGFCQNRGITPQQLASMGDDQLHNTVLDYVTWAEGQGHAGSYIHSTVKATKSWLAHNHREIKAKIKIRGTSDTPTLRDERVPTAQELRKILLSGDKKTRTACVLIAQSGLRIGVLGNYRGTDGLRISDLPETRTTDTGLQIKVVPTMVRVRRELSKAGHQYHTFLGGEGCSYLQSYLEERTRNGEELQPDSAVITPKTSGKEFITSINIGDIVRSAIRGAGMRWRPYVLRSYFDTQLMLAESKGYVLWDYRQFWMGHKGDIENRYTTNKNRLPAEVVEDMRNSYSKSLQLLETETKPTSEDAIREQFRRQLLLLAGFDQEEIENQALGEIDDETFQATVKQRLLGEMINNGATQKVVDLDKIEAHISKGWEYVAALPNGKAILKLPK
jgi:hypothetical protein